jgi:hypothetical protein
MKAKKNYNGYFGFEAYELQMNGWYPEIMSLSSPGMPIREFSVDGGTSRSIDTANASEISLTSEFEQARQYKNIRFLLAPAGPFGIYNLMEIGIKKIPFKMKINMIGRIGKGAGETLRLSADDARLVEMPQIIESSDEKRNFRVKVQFSTAVLSVFSPTGTEIQF